MVAVLAVLKTIADVIVKGIKMTLYGIGQIFKYIGLGLWHGVIKIPYYIYLLFKKIFKRKDKAE